MKYLFFLLLVVNVTVYLWETGAGRESPAFNRVGLSLPDETERIVLIDELPAIPNRSPVPAAQDDVMPEQATRLPEVVPETAQEPALTSADEPADPQCFRLGPYDRDVLAHAALETLSGRVAGAVVVAGPAETINGYWVLYPKAESIEAATLNRSLLQSKGVHDLWVLDKGELTGAISLGIYQTRERAEIAQKQFFARDLKVEVVPRVKRRDAYWVQLHWEGPRSELEAMVADAPGNRQNAQPVGVTNCD